MFNLIEINKKNVCIMGLMGSGKSIIGKDLSKYSKLKFYDGTKWRTTGGAEVSGTTPAGLSTGDFWWDTTNEQLYAYNGSTFVLVGPQGVGDSVTQFQSRVIRDDTDTNRAVIVSVIADEVVHIISSVQFTIGTTDASAYPGFDVVRQGITLKNTPVSYTHLRAHET